MTISVLCYKLPYSILIITILIMLLHHYFTKRESAVLHVVYSLPAASISLVQ